MGKMGRKGKGEAGKAPDVGTRRRRCVTSPGGATAWWTCGWKGRRP